MLTLFAFLVAILILVSLHEFGHYIVARLCGVKVLRFSVGFGKPFYKKQRGDTEWCLAPIPLGGYVKMVDTREGKVAAEDLPYAFDKQHPLKRIAIVAAGPITNLLLAVVLYGVAFSAGVTELKPWVGTVMDNTIASQAGFQAGDKIQSVNGAKVDNWGDAQTQIVLNLEAGKVNVAVQNAAGENAERVINVAGTAAAEDVPKQNGYIGMMPIKLTNTIAAVVKDSPAARAGLQKGDTLISANGQNVDSWIGWADLFRSSPGVKLHLVYSRNGQRHEVDVRPDSEEQADGSLVGKVGLAASQDEAWDKQIRVIYRPSVPEAFKMGWDKTWGYSKLTLEFFGKLFTGKASLNNISGPIAIADVAGRSAALGLKSYLEFLALVSVSLGIMNFLPIPVLDGGHLVYYTAEWILGKPLSERVQMLGLRFGIIAILMLMAMAFFNDITRLFG